MDLLNFKFNVIYIRKFLNHFTFFQCFGGRLDLRWFQYVMMLVYFTPKEQAEEIFKAASTNKADYITSGNKVTKKAH